MQQNTPEQNYYQEDEIDLKELFKILWLKKNLIISITAIITIMANHAAKYFRTKLLPRRRNRP